MSDDDDDDGVSGFINECSWPPGAAAPHRRACELPVPGGCALLPGRVTNLLGSRV